MPSHAREVVPDSRCDVVESLQRVIHVGSVRELTVGRRGLWSVLGVRQIASYREGVERALVRYNSHAGGHTPCDLFQTPPKRALAVIGSYAILFPGHRG